MMVIVPPRKNTIGPQKPSIHHATVVIFLEFFAWGLLTSPGITTLYKTFPHETLLVNGLIQGIKGILSFLSAPLLGALSDVFGRKPFLLLTVLVTCLPIPWMSISPGLYFGLYTLSGLFAVTFSIVFAYVADITPENERSAAYGQVSATFAASFVLSPAIGTYIAAMFGDSMVVLLATFVAVLDLLFIYLVMPESLSIMSEVQVPWTGSISWEQADPLRTLRKATKDKGLLTICVMVFLSYLPEAGQYSCFFVYLSKVIGFSRKEVSIFIAMMGCLSVLSQTVLLAQLVKLGHKRCIFVGLVFQAIQLFWFGLVTYKSWMLWAAGAIASISAVNYPALSALASNMVGLDQQGVAQGVITGVRGLCTGLGPAIFGFLFYFFHVDLNDDGLGLTTLPPATTSMLNQSRVSAPPTLSHQHPLSRFKPLLYSTIDPIRLQRPMAGAPFLLGACLVVGALITTIHFSPRRVGLRPDSRVITLRSVAPTTASAATSLPMSSRHNVA
eukprot:scpid53156/ scgid28931/ Hippocampus abundant transcript-like protein 1